MNSSTELAMTQLWDGVVPILNPADQHLQTCASTLIDLQRSPSSDATWSFTLARAVARRFPTRYEIRTGFSHHRKASVGLFQVDFT